MTLKPGVHPLSEQISLVVESEPPGLRVDALGAERPDLDEVRHSIRARHRLAVTLSPWQWDKSRNCWISRVTSQLTARRCS